MTSGVHRVGLVVDPSFGAQVEELARRMHVWVVRSPDNERAVQRLWTAGDADHLAQAGATLFGRSTETAEEACVAILRSIDEHHGEPSGGRSLDVIEVWGVDASPAIRRELTALGLGNVMATGAGFVATRAPR